MTTRELREHGERLFGPQWQSSLATALGVSRRTVVYWASGNGIPTPAAIAIRSLKP